MTAQLTHSDHNLGFIFDEHLTLSNQISAAIRELRFILPYPLP